MKRTPLKRGPSKLSRKPLRRVGPKRDTKAEQAFRDAVHARAGGRCERCGVRSDLHVHHIVSRARGRNWPGLHAPANGAALCSPCHRGVHEAAVEDWKDWIKRRPASMVC